MDRWVCVLGGGKEFQGGRQFFKPASAEIPHISAGQGSREVTKTAKHTFHSCGDFQSGLEYISGIICHKGPLHVLAAATVP